MPDTTPNGSIDAIEGLLLLHVPPGSELYKVVVLPAHTCVTPVIAGGIGVTVINLVA
jgi:hypothetical protein